MKNSIIVGNAKEELKKLPDNYLDSIVTDPPYEIAFMSKEWDNTGIAYDIDIWKECLRVLKPGGHLLAFSATSTYHKMATAIEEAGFEIRDKIDVFYDGNKDLINFIDSLNEAQKEAFFRLIDQQGNLGLYSWIYGQGFPKGLNISKAIDKLYGAERPLSKKQRPIGGKNGVYDGQGGNWGETEDIPQTEEAKNWKGWNTALKPANEPICVARKPLTEKTIVGNVLKYGTGAMNIDACRIQRKEGDRFEYGVTGNQEATTGKYGIYGHYEANKYVPHDEGRYPANVILDEETAHLVDMQSGIKQTTRHMSYKRKEGDFINKIPSQPEKAWFVSEFGGASRFFFCSKATKKERGEFNVHPTVKPLDLMRELVKLVTPVGGICCDPFCGSGTTLIACKLENINYIGIDISEEYADISKKRLESFEEYLN